MEIKYILLILAGICTAILGVLFFNYINAYIRKNKGLEKKSTVLSALIFMEMMMDLFIFAMLFPYRFLVELFKDSWYQSGPGSIFAITFLFFIYADYKIRHSIQKKKMAKGEKGFLEYYDLRNPMEKEDPGALATKIK